MALFEVIQERIRQDREYHDLLKRAIHAPLLLIDDLDKPKPSEFREAIYYLLIDKRTLAGRPLALSSNVPPPALERWIGGAARSRLLSNLCPVEMHGPDYRLQGKGGRERHEKLSDERRTGLLRDGLEKKHMLSQETLEARCARSEQMTRDLSRDQKRAGQMAFTLAGNLLQGVHSSIGAAYQQILITGHIYPSTGKDSLTHQITEDFYRQPEHEDIGLFGRQHPFEPGRDPDQGIEPER